jgi:hypothetical protein
MRPAKDEVISKNDIDIDRDKTPRSSLGHYWAS